MRIGYIARKNENISSFVKLVDRLFIEENGFEREKLDRAVTLCKEGDIFIVSSLSDVADTVGELMTVYERLHNRKVKFQVLENDTSLIIWTILLKLWMLEKETSVGGLL